MKTIIAAAGLLFCSVFNSLHGQKISTISHWLTNTDKSALFQPQTAPIEFMSAGNTDAVIDIDEKKAYQGIDGFGFALTGGSATPIIKMSASARATLLKELFSTEGTGIGISYIRLSIGASDLNEKVFSYNDLPPGETDTAMLKFDLGPDRADVIPVMKEILAINPSIKILGSPWSPPTWMKTNNDTRGGRLKKEFYPAYAKYFVRYIQDMQKEGITIDAITVQNEPLHPGNNPSLLMPAPDQAEFIRDHLGPAFATAGIRTKIILYDHNADRPDYPILILNDPRARQYIDGSGFHLYGGNIEALTDVHDAHPDKHLYFTEQMVVDSRRGSEAGKMNISSPVSRMIVGASRNWSRNVILWNLAADPEFKPYTDRGGCSMCQGAITIDGNSWTRNSAYYTVAHASKLVRPGSVRIGSNELDGLANVAFQTPGGAVVLIVANNSKEIKKFSIRYKGKIAQTILNVGSVATYSWE